MTRPILTTERLRLEPLDGDRFLDWWCLGFDPSRPDTAELGYRLRRNAWGRGLATEGSRALLDHAFHTVGLPRVWAETMAVNTVRAACWPSSACATSAPRSATGPTPSPAPSSAR